LLKKRISLLAEGKSCDEKKGDEPSHHPGGWGYETSVETFS
jgi:hypothetical protein